MSGESTRGKQFLFVDDDPGFLNTLRELFLSLSRGAWTIHTAENHAQALALMQKHRFDVVVLDLNMPVMDGLQFLRLLARTHPGQQVVILTGQATEENRQRCLDSGAALFLEKVVAPDGFAAVFATLDALASAAPQEGFRGLMRRVGLQDVLQMECLGRKSSVLEVFTGSTRGRIYIEDGAIVHAESGGLQGETALYGLLGLKGGEFNLLPFAEPSRRTISGQYEFLLMEAARLNDEGSAAAGSDAHSPAPLETLSPEIAPALGAEPPAGPVRIEEFVLCSGSGEVLHEWGCPSLERRLKLLNQIEQQALQISSLLRAGRFSRMEILTADGRAVCHVQPDMRLFMRRSAPQLAV